MKFDIITIFPPIFKGFLGEALISRAQKKRIITIRIHNLREWTRDAHKTVDDRPYGGGAGMVLMVETIMKAVEDLKKINPLPSPPHEGEGKKKNRFPSLDGRPARLERSGGGKGRVILFSAKGKKFSQAMARKWSKLDQLIMICGRYEGIDERVAQYIADEEVSIGDYVLFGGEIPAMVVMEAVTRLLPGAVGKKESVEKESFTSALLEHPHYTRPEKIKIGGRLRSVPKVLLSGNHEKIEAWRREQSINITKKRRPDLIK